MKKILFILAVSLFVSSISFIEVQANQPEPQAVVSVEVKDGKVDSKTSKAVEATKEATDKAVKATKKGYNKTVKATKKGYNKTVEATKKGYKKTVSATKDFTGKTVENTKEAFENINPNKPVTLEDLEGKAKVKTLKNERKELKSAYNSRIKDINAKIKLTEKSTSMSDVQRQNKIYTLNKEKADLILQRDAAVKKVRF